MFKRSFLIALLMLVSAPVFAASPAEWLAARLDAVAPGTAPAFIASYDVIPGKEAFDTANANTAYTYDQALAIMAFLAAKDIPHARRIGDALVYAQAHDRLWHDGRLRNAYAAGPAIDTPVKLPGYWDKAKGAWIEDGYQDGSATGNNAWAGVALMRLSLASGDMKYAEAARGIGRWLIDVVGSKGGFRGGFEGFDKTPVTLTWRSTEHNCAALALMRLLDKAFPGQGFGDAADQADIFVGSMWDGEHFDVGTLPDGVTVNKAYVSLDAQTLAPLATGVNYEQSLKAIQYAADAFCGSDDSLTGFDYSSARAGIWVEGTLEMGELYRQVASNRSQHKEQVAAKIWISEAGQIVADRISDEAPSGGLYAIQGIGGKPIESLSTGLKQGNGEGLAWSYYRRVAVAPTAWMIMAMQDYNPLARP